MDIVIGFEGSPASWPALGIAPRERAFTHELCLSRPCTRRGRTIEHAQRQAHGCPCLVPN